MEANAQWTPAYESVAEAIKAAEERDRKLEKINWIVDIVGALLVAAYLVSVLV